MKLQYKLSLFFMFLILMSGIMIIILNTNVLSNSLEKNLLSRERIGMELLEKRLVPYMIVKDYAGVTSQLFEEMDAKKDVLAFIIVYDTNGNMVAHTFLSDIPDDLRHGGEPAEGVLVERHTVGSLPIIELIGDLRDGNYFAGRIFVGYKESYLTNIVSETGRVTVLAIITVGIFTLFAAYLFIRIVVSPISELVGGMILISKGNLDARVNIDTKDELGTLAKIFNGMAGDLSEANKKIDAHSRQLESQVAERTRELSQKVEELTATKTAMLNMMDDAEEANQELSSAHSQLQKNIAELNEAAVKKNEFMSIAAHELKTPMTSIHGFSQLLQNPSVASDTEKRNKYLSIIDHETTRLAKLVNDVLDLSRVDLKAVAFDITSVDVNAVIETVRTELAVQMKTKGLEAEYAVDKRLPIISTDRERLTQVLMNLINNAIKYTPKGKITVSAYIDGKDIHFAVKDTGIGISKANQAKIFTRFYQVDSSYTRSAGGVGLGLSLCKEFVELLGGRIWFRSTEGKGSEFHFALPISGAPKELDANEKNKQASAGTARKKP